MSDFKAKMHQIQFRLRLRPNPCWRSLEHSSRPLVGLKGPTSNGRGGERWKWRERKGSSTFSADLYAHGCLYTGGCLWCMSYIPAERLLCVVWQGKGLMTTYWLQGASPALRRQDHDKHNKVIFADENSWITAVHVYHISAARHHKRAHQIIR